MSLNLVDRPEPPRLSVSSLNTYAECGERWRLERLYGVRKTTWYATVAGSAVHEITELIDNQLHYGTEEPIPTFKEVFDRLLEEEIRNGIIVKPSGKKLVNVGPNGGPNKKDYDWFLHYGPIMVQNWVTFRSTSDWTVLVLPNGDPAIELPVSADIAGETYLGMIDRVMVNRVTGEIVVVDIKTGADSGLIQLGTYRVQLKRQYGIDVDRGAFWSAIKGDLGYLFDLTVYSPAYVDHQFRMAWAGIRAGVFIPNPGNFCNACDGKDMCRAGGGTDLMSIPLRTRVVRQQDTVSNTVSVVAPSLDGV